MPTNFHAYCTVQTLLGVYVIYWNVQIPPLNGARLLTTLGLQFVEKCAN